MYTNLQQLNYDLVILRFRVERVGEILVSSGVRVLVVQVVVVVVVVVEEDVVVVVVVVGEFKLASGITEESFGVSVNDMDADMGEAGADIDVVRVLELFLRWGARDRSAMAEVEAIVRDKICWSICGSVK